MKTVTFESSETIAHIDTLHDALSLTFAIHAIANDHAIDAEYRNAIHAVVRELEDRVETVRGQLETALEHNREAING